MLERDRFLSLHESGICEGAADGWLTLGYEMIKTALILWAMVNQQKSMKLMELALNCSYKKGKILESVFLSILWNEIIIYFNDIAGLFEDVVDLYIFVNTVIKCFKSYEQGWRDQFGVIEFKQSLYSEEADFRHGRRRVKLWNICLMGFQGNAG